MAKKLKIGILTGSLDIPAWIYSAIEKIAHSDYAEIDLVITDSRKSIYRSKFDKFKKRWHKLIFFIFERLDRLIFKSNPNAFELKNLKTLLPGTPVKTIQPLTGASSDQFSEEDIDTISGAGIDILIGLWPRILRGKILTVAKHGIWSYHHGDNMCNRGGPPGFWECVETWPQTGSILQILNEELDGGTVLYRSWALTYPLSPARTKNYYYWTSSSFLPRQIKRLHDIGEEKFFEEVKRYQRTFDFYDRPLYRAPDNLTAVRLIFTHFFKIFFRFIQRLFLIDQWFIMFDFNDALSTSLRKFKKLIPPKDRFWADPFALYLNGKYYTFVEEYIYKASKAHISVIEMDESGAIKPPAVCLKKDYHLSYPFVFKHDKTFFMIPESSANRTVELYKCTAFPHKWEFVMNLMEDVFAVDTTLFYHRNKWWLFTGITENEGGSLYDELFLFYSDTLQTCDWTPHPMNPVVSDVRNARPAGRIFEKNGALYRPSQDCSKIYGHGFNINEIISLSTTNYEEKQINAVKPKWDKKIIGTHTFNHIERLTVIDAFTRRRKFL